MREEISKCVGIRGKLPKCKGVGRIWAYLSKATTTSRTALPNSRLDDSSGGWRRPGLLRGRHLHRTGGSGQRGGCRNLPSGSQCPTVGWRPDSNSERVRGWSLTWARRRPGRLLGPQSRGSLGWADGCPGPAIYCPGAKGGPDGVRGRLYTVCFKFRVWSSPPAWAGLPPRGRSPSPSSAFLSCGSRNRDTGGRLGPGSGRLVGHPIFS